MNLWMKQLLLEHYEKDIIYSALCLQSTQTNNFIVNLSFRPNLYSLSLNGKNFFKFLVIRVISLHYKKSSVFLPLMTISAIFWHIFFYEHIHMCMWCRIGIIICVCILYTLLCSILGAVYHVITDPSTSWFFLFFFFSFLKQLQKHKLNIWDFK